MAITYAQVDEVVSGIFEIFKDEDGDLNEDWLSSGMPVLLQLAFRDVPAEELRQALSDYRT